MYFSFIQLTPNFTLSTKRRTNKQLSLELLPMFFFSSALPCIQHLFSRDTSWLLNKFWKSESIHELGFLMWQGPMPQSAPPAALGRHAHCPQTGTHHCSLGYMWQSSSLHYPVTGKLPMPQGVSRH